MSRSLHEETDKKLEKYAAELSRKLGTKAVGDMTYWEMLKEKLEHKLETSAYKIKRQQKKIDATLKKFRPYGGGDDSTQEIQTFLEDGIRERVEEGYSEEEALELVVEQFLDERDFEEKAEQFLEDWSDYYMGQATEQYADGHYEAIGVFYAAFLFISGGIGALLGYLGGNMILGIVVGGVIGIGLGLLSHGIIALRQASKD